MKKAPRYAPDERWRIVAYAVFVIWPPVLFLFPPVAFNGTVDLVVRAAWLSVVFVGAVIAFIGALLRADIKVELPGLSILLFGPGLYTLSLIWFATVPQPAELVPDPTVRYAITLLVLGLFLMTMGRRSELSMKRSLTKRALEMKKITDDLTPEERAQPGAFSKEDGGA